MSIMNRIFSEPEDRFAFMVIIIIDIVSHAASIKVPEGAITFVDFDWWYYTVLKLFLVALSFMLLRHAARILRGK